MKNANSHCYQFDGEAYALETDSEMPVPPEQFWRIAVMEALRSSTGEALPSRM